MERFVDPALTGSGIVASSPGHFVINPSAAARGRLFVMLPGTGAIARTYRLIVRTGPPRGYHAIGLDYPNDDAVGVLCAGSTDPDCAGKVRREVITGTDTSALVAVSPANSIRGRLTALLTYLHATFPNEGWGQFLRAGQPDWTLITVAGHSQGGGHAAYLAKLEVLDRVAMFSAPGDPGPAAGQAAQWLSLPNITSAGRIYGFTHTADPLIPLATALQSWQLMGLPAFGAPVDVDANAPPFGNSRQLITTRAPNPMPSGPTASPEHGAPVADAVTPLGPDGEPVYRPVWIYMAFP